MPVVYGVTDAEMADRRTQALMVGLLAENARLRAEVLVLKRLVGDLPPAPPVKREFPPVAPVRSRIGPAHGSWTSAAQS